VILRCGHGYLLGIVRPDLEGLAAGCS